MMFFNLQSVHTVSLLRISILLMEDLHQYDGIINQYPLIRWNTEPLSYTIFSTNEQIKRQ